MASSDTDAGELELSSEDEQHHPTSRHMPAGVGHAAAEDDEEQAEGDLNEAAEGDSNETADDAEEAVANEPAADDGDEDSTETTKHSSHRHSLDEGGLSYASQLTHNTRAVIEQAEESRHAMKKMAAFLKDKAELDRYYAKALKKLVDKAAPEPHATLPSATRSAAGNHSPSGASAAASTASSASSSFDLAMSSFRHLSLTLASNFDLLASKTDEHCLRTFLASQQRHNRETKRQAEDMQRLHKQLQSLHDALVTTKANSKRACMDYQIWMMEHREKQRTESDRLARDRAAGLAAGGVDSHTMFDELVASFRWDAESIKKRTLEVDNRYIAAVKALRSFKPQYDVLLKQTLASAQSDEEEERKELLAAMQVYCDIQAASAHTAHDIYHTPRCTACTTQHTLANRLTHCRLWSCCSPVVGRASMFDKYVRNVRAVSAMSQQVNIKREIRTWIKQHKNTAVAAATPAVADRPLPEYVMHKGHPRYGETKEVEEKHEHEGITDDEDESEGGEEDDEDEDEEEGDDEDEEDEDDEEDDEDDDEEEEEDGKQAHGRRRGRRHRRRKGGADELDESEDEKTEERIVAEKVLRVFVSKTIGLLDRASAAASSSSDPAAASAATTATPPVDLSSPTSATLTTPLPRLRPAARRPVSAGRRLGHRRGRAAGGQGHREHARRAQRVRHHLLVAVAHLPRIAPAQVAVLLVLARPAGPRAARLCRCCSVASACQQQPDAVAGVVQRAVCSDHAVPGRRACRASHRAGRVRGQRGPPGRAPACSSQRIHLRLHRACPSICAAQRHTGCVAVGRRDAEGGDGAGQRRQAHDAAGRSVATPAAERQPLLLQRAVRLAASRLRPLVPLPASLVQRRGAGGRRTATEGRDRLYDRPLRANDARLRRQATRAAEIRREAGASVRPAG